MASATELEAPERVAERQPETSSSTLAAGFRWRVVGDPPPPPKPTRYQRLYNFLYEFNRY